AFQRSRPSACVRSSTPPEAKTTMPQLPSRNGRLSPPKPSCQPGAVYLHPTPRRVRRNKVSRFAEILKFRVLENTFTYTSSCSKISKLSRGQDHAPLRVCSTGPGRPAARTMAYLKELL